ncbi:hypothetical protein KC356_g14 [Hortaea werneckii]|nr:hypothetical protein KC356_g14 [Hortaea werneckii]
MLVDRRIVLLLQSTFRVVLRILTCRPAQVLIASFASRSSGRCDAFPSQSGDSHHWHRFPYLPSQRAASNVHRRSRALAADPLDSGHFCLPKHGSLILLPRLGCLNRQVLVFVADHAIRARCARCLDASADCCCAAIGLDGVSELSEPLLSLAKRAKMPLEGRAELSVASAASCRVFQFDYDLLVAMYELLAFASYRRVWPSVREPQAFQSVWSLGQSQNVTSGRPSMKRRQLCLLPHLLATSLLELLSDRLLTRSGYCIGSPRRRTTSATRQACESPIQTTNADEDLSQNVGPLTTGKSQSTELCDLDCDHYYALITVPRVTYTVMLPGVVYYNILAKAVDYMSRRAHSREHQTEQWAFRLHRLAIQDSTPHRCLDAEHSSIFETVISLAFARAYVDLDDGVGLPLCVDPGRLESLLRLDAMLLAQASRLRTLTMRFKVNL